MPNFTGMWRTDLAKTKLIGGEIVAQINHTEAIDGMLTSGPRRDQAVAHPMVPDC